MGKLFKKLGARERESTDNPTVYNRLARKLLDCSYCPPNRKENASASVYKRNHGQKKKKKWERT